MCVTSYQPIPSQTKPSCVSIHQCETSIGDLPTRYGVAASQDLLAKGLVHYGEPVYIEGYGWRIINDTMNVRNHNAFDLMVWSYKEEKDVGVRHLKVWVIHPLGETKCNTKAVQQKNQHQVVVPAKGKEMQPSDTTVHSEPR